MEEENKEIVKEVPMEEPPKKGKIIIILLVAFLILATLVGGIFIGKAMSDKKDDKKENEPAPTEEKKEDEPKEEPKKEDEPKGEDPVPVKTVDGTEVKMSNEEIDAIMARFYGIKISYERLFASDKFDISSINTMEMLATALKEMYIYNACAEEGTDIITLKNINSSLSKYVKKTLTFNDIKNVKSVTMGLPYDIEYGFTAKSENEISVIDRVCDGLFDGDDYNYGKVVKVEKSGDYAYVYEKIAFARYGYLTEGEENMKKVDYYKDYKRTSSIVETLNSKEFSTADGPLENSTPNWDLYNTYKYTFKLIDGTYYFQSFELVK